MSAGDPFVPLPGWARAGYLSFQFLYLVALLLAAYSEGAGVQRYVLILSVTMASLVVGAPVLLTKSYGWFHPIVFPALYGVFSQLRGFPTYAFGINRHSALPGLSTTELDGLLIMSVVLGMISTLSFFIGYYLCPTARVPIVRERERSGLVVRVLVIVALITVVFAGFLVVRGGAAAHFASWGRGRATALSGGYYWVVAIRTASIAVILWLAHRPTALRNPFFWAAALVALMLAFSMTGSRSSVLFYLAIGGIIWMLRRRAVPTSRLVLVAIGFVVLLGALGTLRSILGSDGIIAENRTELGIAESWQNSLDEMRLRSGGIRGDLAIYGNVPQNADFLYGASYLSLLTLPVPRGLWSDKPMVIEAMVGRTFFRVNAGVPPGGVAEAYWNFHVFGILAVYFLYGGLSRWLAAFYALNHKAPTVVAFYAFTLFVLSPTGTSIVGWLFGLVPLIVVALLISQFQFGSRSPGHVLRPARSGKAAFA